MLWLLEHIAKLCRCRRSCKICNKKHPTSLHGYNWKPEQVQTKRKNAQHKESETGRDDQAINACTTICNVTEAGDVPISSQYGCTTRTIQTTEYVYALLDNASGKTFIKEESLS